jgi:DNA-binding NarL/FixJ family response regulator
MRRPADDEIARVLRETRPAPDGGAQDGTHLRMLEARWALWRGESVEQVRARLGEHAAGLRPFLDVDALREGVVRSLQDGAPDADVLRPVDERGLPPLLRGWSVVARAAATLEAGRPDLTLAVCDEVGPGELLPELHHHLDGLHGEALLLLGELREAETWARERLEAAYDALDTVGIRVHACVLAQVLLFAGQPHAAWRVLSTALRLGPAGPLESTYYRRALVLGAALQGRAGALPVARILLAELDAAPRSCRPLVRSLRVLAHAALEVALDHERDASEQMWQRGRGFADRGLMQPALLCWLLSSVPMGAERLRTVRAAYARTPLPLLAPYLRLHEALAAGDAQAVGAALAAGRSWIPAGLTRTAVALVDESRPSVPPPPAVPAATAAARSARDTGGSLALRVQVLSDREREVAVLARAGLTNRQIADQLVLSVRTVENHMSSVLRKLGFSGRGDLDRWTEV